MSSAPEPLRLGFARGIAPSKWQRRWQAAVPERRLELVPVDAAFGRRDELLDAPIDVMLERTAPGQTPEGRALRLYDETIALVLPKDHELVKAAGTRDPAIDSADLGLVTLLDHPDHSPEWPAAEPWADPSYRPRNIKAALRLVGTGLGGILMPLPLARHLISKREHAIVLLTGDALVGSTVWATWAVERDASDVQQLAGVLRGRTARSSRATSGTEGVASGSGAGSAEGSGSSAKPAQERPKKAAKPSLKPNSRGAQLQAAREKAERKKAEKRQEKRRKRR